MSVSENKSKRSGAVSMVVGISGCLLVGVIFCYGAIWQEAHSEAQVRAQEGTVVHTQVTGQGRDMSVYEPYTQYVEQAIRFGSIDAFNEWRREHRDLEIIERHVTYGESAALIGATFTTGNATIDRTTYFITVFYREPVKEE